jgi:hypothetical protein
MDPAAVACGTAITGCVPATEQIVRASLNITRRRTVIVFASLSAADFIQRNT